MSVRYQEVKKKSEKYNSVLHIHKPSSLPPPSLCSHFIVLVNVIVSLTEADLV